MHQSVYFRIAVCAFLVGVGIASFFFVPAWTLWLAIGLGGLCLAAAPQRTALVAGLVFLSAAVGISHYYYARVDDTVLYYLAQAKADVTITGYIDGDVKPGQSGWSVYVRAKTVNDQPVNERVLVRSSGEAVWKYGDGVKLQGRLGRASQFDAFDYPGYLRKEGVRSIMIHPRMDRVSVPLSRAERIGVATVRAIWQVRDAFSASVRRAVPEPAGSYLVGILVGGRAALAQQWVDDFSRTSTSHVLAISGYNITILAAAVMAALASRLGRRRAMIAAVLLIIVFVVMTGANASVVRAAIMGIMVLAAGALGRPVDMETVMVLSAAAMVWFNPLILRDDVGFQMSFAALSGLVWLEPLVTARLGRFAKHPLGRVVSATTAAQMAVMPLILYYFHTLSVVGPLANVLVLPLVPLAMALGFATGLVGLVIPLAAKLMGTVALGIAGYQLVVVRALASLPWSAFDIVINVQIVIALYGILGIWWHVGKSGIKEP